jgi:hypothetical protein
MSERTGGCACGAIRFKITAPLMGVGVCHCKDCQKAAGGPPNYACLVPASALEVTKGEPKLYVCKSESGADAVRAFCADCGSPLWSKSPLAPLIPVKLGALDDSSDLKPDIHMFVSSAASWHLMHEGLPTFEKMPPYPSAE